MLGLPVEKPNKNEFDLDYVGIKASQFSFNRLQKADPVLGVDMASTGEVGCLGDDVSEAVLTSMLAVGQRVPDVGDERLQPIRYGRYAPFLGGEWHSEYEGVLAEREGRTAGA